MVQLSSAQLPPLLRPTPTTAVRLHLETHRLLNEMRLPGESWEAFFRRTILHPRAIDPADAPRKGQRARSRHAYYGPLPGHSPAAGMGAQVALLSGDLEEGQEKDHGSGSA